MPELNTNLLVAAWLTGLAGGSSHCVGMCGGIVAALGLRQPSGGRGFGILLSAHVGRVLGYALVGAIAGYAGAALVAGLLGARGIALMRIAAAALIALIGLELLMGGWRALSGIERGGARLWKHIAPVFRGLLPPRDPLRGLAAGLLWGWLPCGLVYAQLAVATASGGALQGALGMVFFGFGTVLGLSALGVLLHSVGLSRLPRQASGALLIAFALWMVVPQALPLHVH